MNSSIISSVFMSKSSACGYSNAGMSKLHKLAFLYMLASRTKTYWFLAKTFLEGSYAKWSLVKNSLKTENEAKQEMTSLGEMWWHITHHPPLEITGFRTETEDTKGPFLVTGCGKKKKLWKFQLATRSRKMKARENQKDRCYIHLLKAIEEWGCPAAWT